MGKGDCVLLDAVHDPPYICTPTEAKMYTAYNSSSVYPASCTFPMHYGLIRSLCGYLEGKTETFSTDPCTVTGDTATCTCGTGFDSVNYFDVTIEKDITVCFHQNCRNKGLTAAGTNPSDYCNGAGDCVYDSSEPPEYACSCGPTSALYQGTCYPSTCVSYTALGEVLICGGDATRCVQSDTGWICNCPYDPLMMYLKGSCWPSTCIYSGRISDGSMVNLLCGGGGTCETDSTSPAYGTCTCELEFERLGTVCVHRNCVAPEYSHGISVTDNMVCSGFGFCMDRRGGYSCVCMGGRSSIGPFCSYNGCVSIHEYATEGGLIKEHLMDCGAYGAGVCEGSPDPEEPASMVGTCKCNDGYVMSMDVCVHKECVVGEDYCNGDMRASCLKQNGVYTCRCGPDWTMVDGQCWPSRCLSFDQNGVGLLCGGKGECARSSLIWMSCSCEDGYAQAQLMQNGMKVFTCAPDTCISNGQLCYNEGYCQTGTVGSRCVCPETSIQLASAKCVSNVCIGTNEEGVPDECSGKGQCLYDPDIASFGCYSCTDGYVQLESLCINPKCLFTDSTTGSNTFICGRDGSYGQCGFSGGSVTCQCRRSHVPVMTADGKALCIANECATRSGSTVVECGGHGTCQETPDKATCICEAGYVDIDGAFSTHKCVSANCITQDGSTKIVCSNNGVCIGDSCACNPAYGGSKCEICAEGYRKPTGSDECFKYCKDGTCGGQGTCVEVIAETIKIGWKCNCNPDFVESNGVCVKSGCDWKPPAGFDLDTLECGGSIFGHCDESKQCVCQDSAYIVDYNICAHPVCVSTDGTGASIICEGVGICGFDLLGGGAYCMCPSGYLTNSGDKQCYPTTCFQDKNHMAPIACDGFSNKCVVTGSGSTLTGTCTCGPGFQKIAGQDGCVHINCIVDGSVCGGKGYCSSSPDYSSYFCECQSGYFTDPLGHCVSRECSSDGVTVCNNLGTCNVNILPPRCECSANAMLTNSGCYPFACVPMSDGSLPICNGQGMCDLTAGMCMCNEGFRADDYQTCVSERCFTSTSEEPCNGHGTCLATGVCDCDVSTTGQYCTTCNDGYKLIPEGTRCVLYNCFNDVCGGAGTCRFNPFGQSYSCECNQGYYYDHSTFRCLKCRVANCFECSVEGCNTCADGFYKDDSNVCKPCHSACASCDGDDSDECLRCAPGLVHATGIGKGPCVAECTPGTSCGDCGAVIDGSKYCSRCQDTAMVPINGVCSSPITRAAICLRVGLGVCEQCASGYFIFNGGCYETTRLPGSQVCQGAYEGKCTFCTAAYYTDQVSGVCTPCAVSGCTHCPDSAAICAQCGLDTYLNAGGTACEGCHETCKVCNGLGAGACVVCKDGYFEQFHAGGMLAGECRRCDDTRAINGLKGVKGCKACDIDEVGSEDRPVEVDCRDFGGKNSSSGLSGGAIAGIVIAVLLVAGGLTGFLVWWFVFRGKNAKQPARRRGGQSGDDTSVSLMAADEHVSLL